MRSFPLLRTVLILLVVVILGGLTGWYMFVQRQIKTTGIADTARGFGTAASFGSPLGSTNQNLPGTAFTTGSSSSETTAGKGTPAPRLWRVSSSPVAGEGFATSSTQLYFAERATGNILRADPSVQAIERLTNTLFPKIYEALFRGDGEVMLRSQTDAGVITTFVGTVGTTTPGTPAKLSGVYLPQNIITAGVRDGAPQVFALIADPHGGTLGITTDWSGQKQKQLFTSALSGWRAYYLADGKVFLAQKASDGIAGYAFRLDGTTLTTLLSGLPGLVILPRASSTALLYSTSQEGTVALFARSSASSSAVRLPIKTLAEKCVWSPGSSLIAYCAVPQASVHGSYESDWYRGAFHTADAWWRIDASAGTAQEIFTPDSSVTFDAEDPVIDQSGGYIAFRDAANASLWMLRVAQ